VAHATTLSPSDQTAVEVSLRRMIADLFGALATVPLYCLGELQTPDPRRVVLDHYEIWRSCLILAREILRSDPSEGGGWRTAMDAMMSAVAELRDAYLGIAEFARTAPSDALLSFNKLVDTYSRIPQLVSDLSKALDIDELHLPSAGSLRQRSHEGTLNWLGEELRSRAPSQSQGPAGR
jgi:hypothetical protein